MNFMPFTWYLFYLVCFTFLAYFLLSYSPCFILFVHFLFCSFLSARIGFSVFFRSNNKIFKFKIKFIELTLGKIFLCHNQKQYRFLIYIVSGHNADFLINFLPFRFSVCKFVCMLFDIFFCLDNCIIVCPSFTLFVNTSLLWTVCPCFSIFIPIILALLYFEDYWHFILIKFLSLCGVVISTKIWISIVSRVSGFMPGGDLRNPMPVSYVYCTECPKINLPLLKCTANLYLSRCSTDLR